MGSGLILLVIVAAWIAVLVPRGLKHYDVSRSLGSVDRFHDAMRVLSRRHGAVVEEDVAEQAPSGLGSRWASLRARRAGRPPLTAARRRRRLLLGLVLIALGTLVGLVLGPLWVLAPHLLTDLLLGAFVVHLRRTAASRRRAARPVRRPAPRPALADVVLAAPVPAPARLPVHVAGIPDRMPPRVDAPVLLPAAAAPGVAVSEVAVSEVAVSEVAAPAARGAQGEAWSPVPVPTPTYLSAPTAPRPVMDLTRAAANDGLSDAERELGIVDEGPQLDEILDRRRAVNDW